MRPSPGACSCASDPWRSSGTPPTCEQALTIRTLPTQQAAWRADPPSTPGRGRVEPQGEHQVSGIEAFVENRFRQVSVIAGCQRREERRILR